VILLYHYTKYTRADPGKVWKVLEFNVHCVSKKIPTFLAITRKCIVGFL